MFKLADNPSKHEYITYRNQQVLLGKGVVTVLHDTVQTKSGSWERGFKFGSITYGILQRDTQVKSPTRKGLFFTRTEYSADHGKTWSWDIRSAKKVKGKVVVERGTPRGEFAFDSIQRLNREYHGPGYAWKP